MDSYVNSPLDIDSTRDIGNQPLPLAQNQTTIGTTALRISRDEMNLAEFPLTVLSKRSDPTVKTLEFCDSVKGKNGDLINRQWIITGADKFGLPTSSDDEVLLGLLKLTADDGVRSRKVHFTRYELLRILRWTTEGRSYTRLQNALDRLSGVRIKATNAFYDNETKLHSTRNFGIIDAYEINDGRDTRPSFFTWSEVLFKSFQVGFIKKLDLDFYLDLESAVSKRLYRYLDKHFWYRSKIQVNLFTLAHEKIGVSRNYVYASSLKQQLEPALEELKARGVISGFEFSGKGKATEVAIFSSIAPKRVASSATKDPSFAIKGGDVSCNQREVQNVANEREPRVSSITQTVIEALVKRGLADKQAFKLTAGQGSAGLDRIMAIISYFDDLIAKGSAKISKSPTGFLYRAVEKPFEFVLPGDKKFNQADLALVKRDGQQRLNPEPAKESARVSTKRSEHHDIERELAYHHYRSERIEELLNATPQDEVAKIKDEVEQALAKLSQHITPERFRRVVQHGVEQRLLELTGFPELEKWQGA